MRYKKGDIVTLYTAGGLDDLPFMNKRWTVLAANDKRCNCPTCDYLWTASNKTTLQLDYALDINIPDSCLFVYEWQLLPPLEEQEEESNEEEVTA